MKNKQFLSHLLVLGLIVGGTGTIALVQNASAEDASAGFAGSAGSAEEMGRPGMEMRAQVDRTVENISDGVIITLTTEDSSALEHLQSMTEFPAHRGNGDFMESVDQEINLLDNGIQITLRSEDPETVDRLQNMPEPGEKGMHFRRGGEGPLPFMNENVERTVEDIENGVVITLTSEDDEVVSQLQDFEWDEPETSVED
jgi:hypothetical protein